MVNIVVVLPKIEDARGIRSILMKNGIPVSAVCSTGAQTLHHLRDLNDGIVIYALSGAARLSAVWV